MAPTPEEIAQKEFTHGLRGYDQDEVRAFLRLVAAEVEVVTSLLDGSADQGTAGAQGSAEADVAALSDAALILQKAHDEAAEIRQSAAAEAEITRARARAELRAAQDEALRLVAETHARVDRRFAPDSADDGSAGHTSTVEQVGEAISAMVQVREDVLRQLLEVKARLDATVAEAEADPLVGRSRAGIA